MVIINIKMLSEDIIMIKKSHLDEICATKIPRVQKDLFCGMMMTVHVLNSNGQ